MAQARRHRTELQHGLLAALCVLAACTPNAGKQDPAAPGFCVKPAATCNPDPGAPPVDCTAAEAGLEFFAPFNIADFEQTSDRDISDQMKSPKGPIGQFMYSYTDSTAQVYANRDGIRAPVGYEPIATSGKVCTTDSANHVLHVSGGPFLGWGGGLGVAMQHFAMDNHLCYDSQRNYLPASARPAFCEPDAAEPAAQYAALNLSDWDGVAVWARRGPDSQPLLRVLVGNKYTDDDISYLTYFADPNQPRHCERVRECACVNGKTCSWWNGSDASASFTPGDYCGDPTADPPPGTPSGNGVQSTNSCDRTHCNDVYPAYPDRGADSQFKGRPCTPYAFRSGFESSYCYNPATDPPPAESDQQCGDYWTFPLHLTTEWQLFLVPFTTMYQQGWAKRWPFFDTTSVSVVRLTWDAGWVDYWIDNLRFYRVRR